MSESSEHAPSSPKGASEWLHFHSHLFTAFLIGVAVGVVFGLPLLPYKLPDTAAQILGAGLGAGIAVGGVSWVTNAKERQAARALVQATDALINNVLASITTTYRSFLPYDVLGCVISPMTVLSQVIDDCDSTQVELKQMLPMYVQHPQHMLVFLHLQRALADITTEARRLQVLVAAKSSAAWSPDAPELEMLKALERSLRSASRRIS